jgi:transcription-repair coupling factor (superfamily II helicase)
VSNEKELEILEAEWKDRFGAVPTSVKNLLRIVGIKILATEMGIQAIRADANVIKLMGPIPGQAFYKCQAQDKNLVGWSWSPTEVKINRERMLPDEQLATVEKLLKGLTACILTQTV